MIGKTLAHYEITAELGRGGMGEVYRAHDARLGRDVAIKVLPTNLSGNPEIRARFEREAKTVSSLNHPHICTLHDVGSEGGIDFLVMELVEGETLADRLQRGRLPLEEALQIGAQIADALDRAHRAGVIHRDLKPGNIMLTRAGAKLMDFGLARATGLVGPESVSMLEQSPTIAQPLTAEGTIVGTFQYMSPEQLEGHEVDASTDLWALGCVLYEMTTGRRAFDAGSQASLIGAIMHTRPEPVSAVSTMSPPELDRLVNACLEKDPVDRIQSAHDLKLQLSWIKDGATGEQPATTRRKASSPWPLLALVGIAALALGAVLAKLFLPGGDAADANIPRRYVLAEFDLAGSSVPTLSPDGNYVVVSVESGSTRQLYRRDLASFQAAPIPGTEGGIAPFFSPDGAWMGFFTDDAIKKIPIGGGLEQTVTPYTHAASGCWGEDGYIYFTANNGGMSGDMGLSRVPDSGGEPELLLQLDVEAGESEAWLPEFLPDGETILLSIIGGEGSGWRVMTFARDGSRKLVRNQAFLGRFIPPDHLLYMDSDTQGVFAARFDPGTATITGSPLPLTTAADLNYCFSVNASDIVFVPVPGAGEGSDIVWRGAGGPPTVLVEERALWRQPRLSPNGTRLLLRKVAGECELWMYDIERETLGRLLHGNDHHDPVWSEDGRQIVYQHAQSNELVLFNVDGPRETKVLLSGSEHGTPTSWSRGLLAYTRTGRGTQRDIWIYTLDGSQPPFAYLETVANETSAAISPDGNWIAYVSDETGGDEVYLRRYPDDGSFWQLSTDGGQSPLWARDGNGLYYQTQNHLMRVAVELSDQPRLGRPELLFDGGIANNSTRSFDVGADGRFAMLNHPDDTGYLQQIRVLQNWKAELKRLEGTGR